MPRIYKSLMAEVDAEHGGYRILAPQVGYYYRPPELGAYLQTGSIGGVLKSLNSLVHLRVPEKIFGFVTSLEVHDIENPVAYRQPLFHIAPAQSSEIVSAVRHEMPSLAASDEAQAPEGTLSVVSPTEGIFYRRSSPDSPPYVKEGQVVSTGDVLGLVEVMKSFNQIRYGGPEYPPKARVTKILAGDAQELHSSQAIFWLEPVE